MTESTPSLKEWRRLYEAAIGFKAFAPWEWMTEDVVFGVQNPETDELGFASVMGMLGEHYALAVYLGAEALYGFWAIADEGPGGPPERILEIPQLQASWEDRNTLHKDDRALIKELGLKFRGRNEWPMFRSFRPGYAPWFLEATEARFLACALEQALDVLSRFREDSSLLEPPDEESYLVRVPHRGKEALIWEDRIVRVLPPAPKSIPMVMNLELLEALKGRPRGQHSIEVDFFLFPGAFREKRGDRPRYAYALMTVEAQSGFILGQELMQVETTLEEMWGTIPMYVVNQLAMLGAVPRQVRVRTPFLEHLLQPLAEDLGFRLRQSNTLRSLDQAKRFLLDRFM